MECPNCKKETSTNWKEWPPQCSICKLEIKDHSDGVLEELYENDELEWRGD